MSSSSSMWRWGRRSRRCRSNNLSLPEELLEEIVSWLPVKSILRFRCVKKSWSTLLQNPNFIAKHLHHKKETKNPSILVQSSDLIGGYGFSLHPYPDDNDDVVVGRIVNLSKDLGLVTMQQTITINMFSCINGIICIGGSFRAPGGRFHSFVLWNPAIRERKIISYPMLPGPPAHLHKPYNSKAFYAFGYDQYSNDYKVVRIVTYNKDSPPTQKSLFTDYYNFFHVFSLNAHSWARVIDNTIHRSNIRLLSPCYEIYFNGAHHWLGFFDNGHINQLGENCDCEIILSFDMSHEVFRIMKLPDEVFRKLRYPVPSMQRVKDFCVFNDCLAFVVYKEDTVTENHFDIWAMREYGVEDSWTKQLVVGPLLGINRPLQFFNNGVLFLAGDNDAIVLYDICSNEIRNLRLPEFPESFISIRAMVYVESLVSLTGVSQKIKKK